MLQEFKDFINKGNLVDFAVAVILAGVFGKVVEAFTTGIVGGVVAALFGKPSFGEIGFDLGKGRIQIGTFLDAVLAFVITAFVLFMIVKAYNKMRKDNPAGPSSTDALLMEIRDALKR